MKEHTVCTGETLWGITQRYYGTGALWRQLAHVNGLTPIALVVPTPFWTRLTKAIGWLLTGRATVTVEIPGPYLHAGQVLKIPEVGEIVPVEPTSPEGSLPQGSHETQ